jgi:hypothetical protein
MIQSLNKKHFQTIRYYLVIKSKKSPLNNTCIAIKEFTLILLRNNSKIELIEQGKFMTSIIFRVIQDESNFTRWIRR